MYVVHRVYIESADSGSGGEPLGPPEDTPGSEPAVNGPVSMLVTKIVGKTVYGDDQKVGTYIDYYTDNSFYPESIAVSNEDVTPGWYIVDKIEEGMTLESLEPGKYVDYRIESGNDDTAYGHLLTLGGYVYEVASDITVVDLAEWDITTWEDLKDAITYISNSDRECDPLRISFVYSTEGDTRVVRRVYVEDFRE